MVYFFATVIALIIVFLIIGLPLILVFKIPEIEKRRLETNHNFNNKLYRDLQAIWDFRNSKTEKIPELTAIRKPNKFPPETYFQIISFDNRKKKILIVDYVGQTHQIVDFADIIDYEILENNSTSSTTIGSAYGQGIYAGIASSDSYTLVKNLKLVIRMNNFKCPQVIYEFVKPATEINKTSESYQKLYAKIQNVISLLEIIKKQNNDI